MRSKNYGINVRVTEQEKQKLLENHGTHWMIMQ